MANLQYAQLPKFEYQTFERQYQTFDRQTLQFSFYPVTAAASSDGLTSDKDQDTTNNATHSEEGPSLESAPVEESGSPVDAAPAPESEGTHDCQSPLSGFDRGSPSSHSFRVT